MNYSLVNFRIAKLCQTLINCVPPHSLKDLDQWDIIRETNSFTPLVDYLGYLRELDLIWLMSISWNTNSDLVNGTLDFCQFFISIEVAEILAKYLWITHGHRIRKLVLSRSIPLEQFLPLSTHTSLTTLDIELVSFKSLHAELINKACSNLKTLKIIATVVDDIAVAKVIAHQTPGSIRKLVIRSMESYSIHHTIDTLLEYHYKSITHLKLSMCILTLVEPQDKFLFNSALSKLSQFPNLISLKLAGWKLADDETMLTVAHSFHKLHKLRLENVPFTSNTIEAIVRAAGKNLLQSTILIDNQELGRVLPALGIHCPNIRYLDIQKMRYQSKHLLQCLKSCGSLKTLKLGTIESMDPMVADRVVCGIAHSLNELEHLYMGQSKISEASLHHLSTHPNLKCLRLNPFAYTFSPEKAQALLEGRVSMA
ncbi:hypothetical protein K493DRAFT_341357 [Basidiobolus meristosporus CBS 931.73]|uniref:RNI-like protein n=1 Tax=Basidiobolus meristosporus CBS 931.73 TaxID=1314790 RepID=A0A1Y1XS49_9FUNG|nr:hypothetical protein K493DRAFT_341357 [Basidiobolus meristosporus CBS 931.73]|eukprot:ORX88326.1 hypothetical protein K493DRAFT_341357 [Basidiobolus meristosporus CBS 931.73]